MPTDESVAIAGDTDVHRSSDRDIENDAGGRSPGMRVARAVRGSGATPVVVGIAPFVIVLVAALAHVGRAGINQGDYALIEMSTRSALGHRQMLGPYSRFAWNHPGPLMFYWFAPFYSVFGHRPESLGVASAVLNTLFAAGSIAIAGWCSGRRAAWTVAGAMIATVAIWGFVWIDRIWNPLLVLMPLVGLGFLGAAVLSGRRWALPGFVLVAVFAVQTHLGTLPMVALFSTAVAIGVGVSARRQWRFWLIPGLASAAVGVVAFLPPLYEQATSESGNLTELVRFFQTAKGGHSPGEVLDKTSVQLTLTKVGLIHTVATGVHPIPPASAARLIVLALVVAIVVWGMRSNGRAGRRFEQHLCVFAGLAGAGAFVGGLRVIGNLEGYLTLPATAAGTLLWMAALLTLAGEFHTRARPSLYRLAGRIGPIAVALGCVWSSLWMIDQDPARSLQVPLSVDGNARSATAAVSTALPPRTHQVLITLGDALTAPTAAMVANQLELGGIDTREDSVYDFLFGRDRRPDGCETIAIRIGLKGSPPDPDWDRPVATYDGQVIQTRALQPEPHCSR